MCLWWARRLRERSKQRGGRADRAHLGAQHHHFDRRASIRAGGATGFYIFHVKSRCAQNGGAAPRPARCATYNTRSKGSLQPRSSRERHTEQQRSSASGHGAAAAAPADKRGLRSECTRGCKGHSTQRAVHKGQGKGRRRPRQPLPRTGGAGAARRRRFVPSAITRVRGHTPQHNAPSRLTTLNTTPRRGRPAATVYVRMCTGGPGRRGEAALSKGRAGGGRPPAAAAGKPTL